MPNVLAAESSPYLLQHAENPVDWYPWGDEALALAKELDRPILLSIGYSSCHWCHVMAHESFEDQATADLMNAKFINIKVDREERPDIDAIYMEAAQAISGHGGWPLTVFLDSEQVPFFAGTYFPPEPRPNTPSFQQILLAIDEAWTTQRDEVEATRDQMLEALSRTARLQAPEDPIDAETISLARSDLASGFDGRFGGFGGAPKFPACSVVDFLLGQSDEAARKHAIFSLEKMADGGIHDQIGGGFSRYSVDERWHIPHFEKMLYDNALLVRNYVHAWQLTGEEKFAVVARSTLDWLLKEMRGDEGGFASALDADSIDADGHLEEGAFYAWEIDELREVVEAIAPGHVGDVFTYWGVIDHGEFEGKNVLFVNAPERRPPDEVLDQIKTRALPTPLRATLADARRQTHHGMERIGDRGIRRGRRSTRRAALHRGRDRLRRVHRARADRARRPPSPVMAGRQPRPGRLPGGPRLPHRRLSHPLRIDRPERDGSRRHRKLADLTIEHFEDREGGGFFSVAADHEKLIVRRKDIEDSPIPSGNSAAALALLRLAAFTGEQRYADQRDSRASDRSANGRAICARFRSRAAGDRLPCRSGQRGRTGRRAAR